MYRVTAVTIAMLLQGILAASAEAILDVFEVTAENIHAQALPLDVRVNRRDILHDVIVVATFDSSTLDNKVYVIGGALDIPGVVSTAVMSRREGATVTWQSSVRERQLEGAVFRIAQGVRDMPGGSIWNVQLATFLPGQAKGPGSVVVLPVVAGALIVAVALVWWRQQKGGTVA